MFFMKKRLQNPTPLRGFDENSQFSVDAPPTTPTEQTNTCDRVKVPQKYRERPSNGPHFQTFAPKFLLGFGFGSFSPNPNPTQKIQKTQN
jgi:hypothetical protein